MRRGTQLTSREAKEGIPLRRTWTIDADDFGLAPTKVICGDLDGSGEAPGVQLEFEHVGCPQGAAVAYSAREAELVSRALSEAASRIKPSERLRQRHRKWTREDQMMQQPERPAAIEVISLGSVAEASALAKVLDDLDDKDPRKKVLADVIAQLEIPF